MKAIIGVTKGNLRYDAIKKFSTRVSSFLLSLYPLMN
jgi:hypothetical protein